MGPHTPLLPPGPLHPLLSYPCPLPHHRSGCTGVPGGVPSPAVSSWNHCDVMVWGLTGEAALGSPAVCPQRSPHHGAWGCRQGCLASALLLESSQAFCCQPVGWGGQGRGTCRVGHLPFHTALRCSAHGPPVYLTGRPAPRGPDHPGLKSAKSPDEQAGPSSRSAPAQPAAASAQARPRPPC